MIRLPVHISGDHWINVDQVLNAIKESPPEQEVVLDLGTEGVSFTALGITRDLLEICQTSQRDPRSITIESWPNIIEEIPFTRSITPRISHFFWHSQRYLAEPVKSSHQYLFAYFMGRRTIARSYILHDLYTNFHDNFLFSLMRTRNQELPWIHPPQGRLAENIYEWLDHAELEKFNHWWASCPVESLDNHEINDQYQVEHNTNASISSWYHCVDIELVAESYTLGTTFFPTEKTVRPIANQRPFIVYGPKNFLANLQKYGFKTFSECWNEDYDLLEGPDRYQAIRNVISLLISNPNRLEILNRAFEIAKYNREVLLDCIKKYSPS